MRKQWSYFLFLVWFSYLAISSILLFKHGFLLTRTTDPANSTCIRVDEVDCNYGGMRDYLESKSLSCTNEAKSEFFLANAGIGIHVCFPQRAKVVLLVIDALRFDFAVYNASITSPLPYQNKLPVIEEVLRKYPNNSRLFQFIADPPTTTMQRLKALTTGTLPTFIDAGSNFASTEIDEDNLIDQINKQGYKTVFLGDDTWTNLYPKRFLRQHPYPSFNVYDLDTVDRGVKSNIYDELDRDDWSLLIGHFLGVDHCGHRYGPNHPEMTRKLTEMDEVIRKVIQGMDERTMLFVIGDHGMTSTGDHGGESPDEVKAAMFIYSKEQLSSISTSQKEPYPPVKQVDLVPTLAQILGVPIPHSNLGMTILEALPKSGDTMKNWQTAIFATWSNINQMYQYIKEYSERTNTFSKEAMEKAARSWKNLNNLMIVMKGQAEHFETFLGEATKFAQYLRGQCEEVWIQFDSFSMTRGLLLMFLISFFVYMIVDGIPHNRLPEVFVSSFLAVSYLSLAGVGLICCGLFYLNYAETLYQNLYFWTGLVSLFMLVMLVIQNFEIISTNFYNVSKNRDWSQISTRIILLLSVCSLFSNSFIVEEAHVLLFLLSTLIFISVLEIGVSLDSKSKFKVPFRRSFKFKGIIAAFAIGLLIRFSLNYIRCREEQSWCRSFASNRSISTKEDWAISLLSLALLVTITRIWLRDCGNLVGHSPTVLLSRYTPTVLVVCILGFWIFGTQSNTIALAIYAIISLGISTTILKPLCIYILPKNTNLTVENSKNLIPQIFRQVKEMIQNREAENDEIPIVCGLATVYTSFFVVISLYLTLLLTLLLGILQAPSAVIMFFTGALYLIISSLVRYQKASTITDFFDVPSSCLLTWVMMSLYFFYASGHQPTFSNIPWEAAFIGTGGNFENNFVPAGLIVLNTFGSYILFGVALPLLIMAPFSIFAMAQSWVKKSEDKDFSRGDVLIYENESIFLDQVFNLSCKYILCHAIRAFASMLTATIHCRHLMVWAIFAPKLIFESIGLIVTVISVLIGYLLTIRINHKVDTLIKSLNHKNR